MSRDTTTPRTIEEPVFVPAASKREATKGYADIAVAKKVDGGYMLFAFTHQYDEWAAQCGDDQQKKIAFVQARPVRASLYPAKAGQPRGNTYVKSCTATISKRVESY